MGTRNDEKLAMLGFPYEFAISGEKVPIAQFKSLLNWLEDTQIRLWDEEERKAFKADIKGEAFWSTLNGYLQELNYPKTVGVPQFVGESIRVQKDFHAVIDFLILKSIKLHYQDNSEQYQTSHDQFSKTEKPLYEQPAPPSPAPKAAPAPKPAGKAGPPVKTSPIVLGSLEELQETVRTLESILKLPPSASVQASLGKIATSVKHIARLKQGEAKNEFVTNAELLSHFPLNFKTGDKKLDDASRLLTILYTADLRDLQDKIDETLVQFQNITGDPRTDSRLGKVGS